METNRRFYCDERTEVETAEGRVRGAFLNDHYYFRGIPYANARRFEMPEPMPHSSLCSDTGSCPRTSSASTSTSGQGR